MFKTTIDNVEDEFDSSSYIYYRQYNIYILIHLYKEYNQQITSLYVYLYEFSLFDMVTLLLKSNCNFR